MTKLIEFDVGNGETVLIEVDEVASKDIKPISKNPGELAAKARQTLSQALDGIAPMVRTMKQRLNTLTDPGDQLEVKFSVKMSGEVGSVITKVGGEATYEITVKWANR